MHSNHLVFAEGFRWCAVIEVDIFSLSLCLGLHLVPFLSVSFSEATVSISLSQFCHQITSAHLEQYLGLLIHPGRH